MNLVLPSKALDPKLGGVLKVAIMAVGGQGGGVLTAWIEAVARSQGYVAQATSVAGVSQRTGATIYYVEMAPASKAAPIFSLAPAGGDVDVLIAAEMMEVGRAIMRGFVTPDRTTLIGSTHRALAVSEKTVPGDGIADAEEVQAAAEIAAQRVILADMDALAVGQGSVISASLFGALAGSEALPFPREAYEEAIRKSGKGVEASLRAFAAGFDAARGDVAPSVAAVKPVQKAQGPDADLSELQSLEARIAAMPAAVHELGQAGLRKVVGFQDVAYGAAYLDRLDGVLAVDNGAYELSAQAAKYIANAMAYDDIIRVADLKTRGARFARIHGEMGKSEEQVLHLTEFFHPRAEEVAGLMPAAMGAKFEASDRRMALLDRLFNRGRRLRTDGLRAFGMLYVLGGLQGYRLRTRRHAVEVAHLEEWLSRAIETAARDYALAVEVLRCRRLVKGYSDTHARGLSKFDRVMEAIRLVEGRKDAAEWAARLREAALKDEDGIALDGAIATVKSFV